MIINQPTKLKKYPKKGQYIRTEAIRNAAALRAIGNTFSKGRIYSPETIEKIRTSNLGKKHPYKARLTRRGKPTWNKGTRKLTLYICITCNKSFNLQPQKGRKYCSIKCYRIANRGKGNYRWIQDRTKIIGRHNRNIHDPCTKQWRKSVWERDNWKCRINNSYCFGRIEAHHILRWKNYSELRYNTNNGITLCHFHHPKTKSIETKLAPLFRKLIDNHKL